MLSYWTCVRTGKNWESRRQDASVKNQLADWGFCGPQWPTVEQTKPRWERNAAMVTRRTWVNIAVRPFLQLISHTQQTSPFRKQSVRGLYFCKEVYSFIYWSRHYSWLCSRVYLYTHSIPYNSILNRHLGLDLVWFNGISTIAGYLNVRFIFTHINSFIYNNSV